MSALGQKRTCAVQEAMSALPPIATVKADISKRSCLLYPQNQTCAPHSLMSALGQKRTRAAQQRQALFDHLARHPLAAYRLITLGWLLVPPLAPLVRDNVYPLRAFCYAQGDRFAPASQALKLWSCKTC